MTERALDPEPPRPPGVPDLDLDIPLPGDDSDSKDAEGDPKPRNEDVEEDAGATEPPD
ncbi:hypothetical protein [Pseudonocardia sp. TRM90224]|uniref:hypothetical protein n=1 Tax=Pseudonocardia sp. TRM90224 TaxID=2812678 RepID=UPI001E44D18C|nr:hypothetical protein [Pseudonocardia sp. TRM90224]